MKIKISTGNKSKFLAHPYIRNICIQLQHLKVFLKHVHICMVGSIFGLENVKFAALYGARQFTSLFVPKLAIINKITNGFGFWASFI